MNKKQIKELQLEVMIALVEMSIHNGYHIGNFFFTPRQGYDWGKICMAFEIQMAEYKEVAGCDYQEFHPLQYQNYLSLLTTTI